MRAMSGGAKQEALLHPFSALDIAKEVGGFYSDVLESLIPIRDKHRGKLMLGHGAIASWFKSPRQCGTGQPQGKGQLGLNFFEDDDTHVSKIVHERRLFIVSFLPI